MRKIGLLIAMLVAALLLVSLGLSACKSQPASAPQAPAPALKTTPAPAPAPVPTPKPTPTPSPAPATPTPASAPAKADPASIARGGAMYDTWWKVVDGATEPKGNQSLWSLQATNTNTGGITWRCKECHGWDYKGKDGAYAKGSHVTGFPGVYNAGTTKTKPQLLGIMKGAANSKHDFAATFGEKGLTDVVNFLSEGLIDVTKNIDYSTKKVIGADSANGKKLYDGTCAACHGTDGRTLKFDGKDVVGTLAKGNPWETLHKIRFGHPGSPMPRTLEMGWKTQDAIDVLGYSQTLPVE